MTDTRENYMSQKHNADNSANAIWEILHKQADIVRDQGAVLAETKAEVKGLGGQLRDFIDAYREGQSHVMGAIENMSRPKPNQLWQIVAVCLVILGMFGTVMMATVSGAKEVAQLKFEHAKEVGDLKFGDANGAAKQQQVELKALYQRQEQYQANMQTMAFEGGKQQQKLEDLERYFLSSFASVDAQLVRLYERHRETEVSAAANETNLKATNDNLNEHTNKQGNSGHPSPVTEVRVKEQPTGVQVP